MLRSQWRPSLYGHDVVCFKGEQKVVAVDSDGNVVHEVAVPGEVHGAVTLPGGNLLTTCGDVHKVEEVDSFEKTVRKLAT